MDVMKQYADAINKILEGVQPKRDKYAAKIREAETELRKAEADMNTALIAGDDKAYSKAKEARDQAETDLQFSTQRMNKFDTEPLISAEEYERMVNGIKSAIATANNADKRHAVKLCEKLLEITDSNSAMIEEGNNLLHRLQYEVYRAADCEKNKYGEVLGYGYQDKKFDDKNSLYGWTNYALRGCVQYDALRGSVNAGA